MVEMLGEARELIMLLDEEKEELSTEDEESWLISLSTGLFSGGNRFFLS